MNKQDVELPKIVWEYGNIPTNAKEGEYLLISSDVDGEEPDPSFVVASFYNGFLDTGTYIPEEDMVAYAYLGSQRRSHRRCAALSRSVRVDCRVGHFRRLASTDFSCRTQFRSGTSQRFSFPALISDFSAAFFASTDDAESITMRPSSTFS